MSKPTIVLIPGAWHTPAHFELFLQQLHDAGYTTSSKQLPSVGSADPNNQSVTADMDFIPESLLLPELDQGKDVILIMHSYGGSPVKGGIIGLIFMCAFLSNEGDSIQSKLPGQKFDPWLRINEETGQIDADTPESVFYNNVDDSLVKAAIDRLKQQALSSLNSPSPPSAWTDEVFDGRRAYIQCQQDKAIPYIAQSIMVSMSGLEWHELDLEDAGHSPLSSADPMINFINERANERVN